MVFNFFPIRNVQGEIAFEYSWRTENFEEFSILHNISMHVYLSFKKCQIGWIERAGGLGNGFSFFPHKKCTGKNRVSV